MRSINRLHIVVGLLTFAAFLATGVYMHFALPGLIEQDHALRFTHRANHIYLLLAGLINLVMGVYVSPRPQRWRRTMQRVGSIALLLAPAVLLIAFLAEAHSTSEFRPVTAIGVMTTLAGSLLHLFGLQRRRDSAGE